MIKLDHYDILGVPHTASSEQIRGAHRALALQYHPDTAVDGVGDPQIFAEIQQAYDVLSNRDNRRRYDKKIALERGETPIGTPKRPPRAPCRVCGVPVYASQLQNYLGRYMCKDCLARMGRYGGRTLRLNGVAELRWQIRRAGAFAHRHILAIVVISAAILAATARVVWVASQAHHAGRSHVVTPLDQSSNADSRGNPCRVPSAASDPANGPVTEIDLGK
ncbi:MAG TPA: J domain-containing protein [Tepidisphaeraceae bacterium]|nr:J domain-containing protein [Tepidisphaeraceae bacterium]